ncbi:MAG: 16S rRNA (cytosine(1402)-N(4))-methyltransferase RsmH [Nitrospirota bacterium]
MHIPVLLKESVEFLNVKPDGDYADLTLGLGGHAEEILKKIVSGRLIGIDKDMQAITRAEEALKKYGEKLTVFKADFREAGELIRRQGYNMLDGFIMDLGVSTLQLKTPGRGFGFAADAPLDMRMDQSRGESAADLVNSLSESGLSKIIFEYGEERWAKKIARTIAERREHKDIKTTRELARAVEDSIPRGAWPPKLHPATRTFQGLRIAVNGELDALKAALPEMVSMLKAGGRAVVISYHSLEDRLVKDAFRAGAKPCTCPPDFPECVCGRKPSLKILTSRPVVPSEEEIKSNPSARSAKLRAAEKI